MKKAIRIVSAVYLVLAIVDICVFIISLFASSALANWIAGLVAETNNWDPEVARYYVLVVTIITGVSGILISGGQLALAIINRNCALVELSKGERIALCAVNYAFGLYPLFALHLVYLIKHRHDKPEVIEG